MPTEPIVIEAQETPMDHDCTEGVDPDTIRSEYATATVIDHGSDDTRAQGTDQPAGKGKAIAQTVVGGVVALAGIPMMILPGPGLAAIVGGGALAAKGISNLTGKDVISKETQGDPDYQRGQRAGEELVGRMRTYAHEDLKPIAIRMKDATKTTAHEAKDNFKEASSGLGGVASKGFEAVVGQERAQRASDLSQRYVSPAAHKVASAGKAVGRTVGPVAAKAAKAGGKVAASAGKAALNKAKEILT